MNNTTDTDGYGVLDGEEICEDDSYTDQTQVYYMYSNPNMADSDNDGINEIKMKNYLFRLPII